MYHRNNHHLFIGHAVNKAVAINKALAKLLLTNFRNNRAYVREFTQTLCCIQNLFYHCGCIEWRVFCDICGDGIYIIQRLG